MSVPVRVLTAGVRIVITGKLSPTAATRKERRLKRKDWLQTMLIRMERPLEKKGQLNCNVSGLGQNIRLKPIHNYSAGR
jgi:hypothetical protein